MGRFARDGSGKEGWERVWNGTGRVEEKYKKK